jgi:AraC-like DNA-binding protein
MDLVSDALRHAAVESVIYCRLCGRCPWSLDVDVPQQLGFHYIVDGHCEVIVGDDRVALMRGDLIVLNAQRHILSEGSMARSTSLRQLVADLLAGGAHPMVDVGRGMSHSAEIVCGEFRFDPSVWNPLMAVLPSRVVVPAKRPEAGTLADLLRATRRELEGNDIASTLMVERLGDALFVEVLRHVAASGEDATGWLAAVRDPTIGAALGALHADMATSWTVDALASVANMSRSSFTERFGELVGCAPHEYLVRWRMVAAAGLLRDAKASIAEVAAAVGYESASTFGRAFKARVGMSPGAFRSGDGTQDRSRQGGEDPVR